MNRTDVMAPEEAKARLDALTMVHRAMNKRRRRLSNGAEALLFALACAALLGVILLMTLAHR